MRACNRNSWPAQSNFELISHKFIKFWISIRTKPFPLQWKISVQVFCLKLKESPASKNYKQNYFLKSLPWETSTSSFASYFKHKNFDTMYPVHGSDSLFPIAPENKINHSICLCWVNIYMVAFNISKVQVIQHFVFLLSDCHFQCICDAPYKHLPHVHFKLTGFKKNGFPADQPKAPLHYS